MLQFYSFAESQIFLRFRSIILHKIYSFCRIFLLAKIRVLRHIIKYIFSHFVWGVKFQIFSFVISDSPTGKFKI